MKDVNSSTEVMKQLNTLLLVKHLFDKQTDNSTKTNGYVALLAHIEAVKSKCELDITIHNIISVYCLEEKIPYEELTKKTRKRAIVDERKHIGYFIVEHKQWIDGFSLEKLGLALGGQHHSTIINLKKVAAGLIKNDKGFSSKYNRIEALLKTKFGII